MGHSKNLAPGIYFIFLALLSRILTLGSLFQPDLTCKAYLTKTVLDFWIKLPFFIHIHKILFLSNMFFIFFSYYVLL